MLASAPSARYFSLIAPCTSNAPALLSTGGLMMPMPTPSAIAPASTLTATESALAALSAGRETALTVGELTAAATSIDVARRATVAVLAPLAAPVLLTAGADDAAVAVASVPRTATSASV